MRACMLLLPIILSYATPAPEASPDDEGGDSGVLFGDVKARYQLSAQGWPAAERALGPAAAEGASVHVTTQRHGKHKDAIWLHLSVARPRGGAVQATMKQIPPGAGPSARGAGDGPPCTRFQPASQVPADADERELLAGLLQLLFLSRTGLGDSVCVVVDQGAACEPSVPLLQRTQHCGTREEAEEHVRECTESAGGVEAGTGEGNGTHARCAGNLTVRSHALFYDACGSYLRHRTEAVVDVVTGLRDGRLFRKGVIVADIDAAARTQGSGARTKGAGGGERFLPEAGWGDHTAPELARLRLVGWEFLTAPESRGLREYAKDAKRLRGGSGPCLLNTPTWVIPADAAAHAAPGEERRAESFADVLLRPNASYARLLNATAGRLAVRAHSEALRGALGGVTEGAIFQAVQRYGKMRSVLTLAAEGGGRAYLRDDAELHDLAYKLATGFSVLFLLEDLPGPHPLTHAQRALEDALLSPVTAHVYLSAPGKGALGAHTDPYDVVVVQLAGAKRWRVCAPRQRSGGARPVRKPLFAALRGARRGAACGGETLGERALRAEIEMFGSAGGASAFTAEDLAAMDCEAFEMVAGDVLYLPRSFVHVAETTSSGPSMHVTFGEKSDFKRYSDLMKHTLNEAGLDAAASGSLAEALPFGDVTRNGSLAEATVGLPLYGSLAEALSGEVDALFEESKDARDSSLHMWNRAVPLWKLRSPEGAREVVEEARKCFQQLIERLTHSPPLGVSSKDFERARQQVVSPGTLERSLSRLLLGVRKRLGHSRESADREGERTQVDRWTCRSAPRKAASFLRTAALELYISIKEEASSKSPKEYLFLALGFVAVQVMLKSI